MPANPISFNPMKDIGALANKTIIVTGGNSGLGLETVRQLAQHSPSHIYLATRSPSKADAAISLLRKELPASTSSVPITHLPLDLSSFASIKAAVSAFRSESPRLDILINNAGVMHYAPGRTIQGHEIHMGTNLLGPALFTQLLLPSLNMSPSPRVVFVASELEGQAPVSKKDPLTSYSNLLASTKTSDLSTTTGAFGRYGLSKVATVHYAAALARKNPNLTVASVHPGVVNTGLSGGFTEGMNPFYRLAMRATFVMMGTTVEKGALGPLWAATAGPTAIRSGEFYHPVGVTGKGSQISRDEKAADILWGWVQRELEGHVSNA